MIADPPTILALDFDGVVCDGLIEYFQTAWRTYCQIWSPTNLTPPDDLAAQFYRLRPVVETGWEMPVLLRALMLGVPEAKILQDWQAIARPLLRENNLNPAEIALQVDQIRDEWIATDLDDWLGKHRFYPGVIEKIKSLLASSLQVTIVTTKEGRFVHQLLQQQGINLRDEWIIGKEVQQPKHQTLRQLLETYSSNVVRIWFVEDRLKTLESIQQQSDLNEVRLYLADWGYNTLQMRESILHNPRIRLLSLSQFAQDFSVWN